MKRIRNRYLLMLDILLGLFSYILMIGIVFPLSSLPGYFAAGLGLIVPTAFLYVAMYALSGVYRVDWIFAGVWEYFRLLGGTLAAAVLSLLGGFLMHSEIYPKLNFASNLVIASCLCGARFAVRLICRAQPFGERVGRDRGKRTLIIGSGRLAAMLLRNIAENDRMKYDVVGLIDDDPKRRKARIYNSDVIGTRADILRLCRERQVEQILFAIYNISPENKAQILDLCNETGLKVQIVPGMEDTLNGKLNLGKMREIVIEDLLERAPIQLDNRLIESEIYGQTVMVTGGGGSIGSELCRQIIRFRPKRLIILDIYENTTYELQNELEERYPDQELTVLIASVRDRARLEEIFEKYRPNLVFHAAAHKHVPLMEFSPCEAIKNNIFGTYNTAKTAIAYGVRRFVLISTDKAVNPTNVMGASKRMCEMIIQTMQNCGKTEFAAVRFGNVLGSNGSVIPRFRKQIAAGGPVTVTHPDITRFFMTIPEAAQLVLQAAAYARGGEIFVLDMGKPVKIADLAKKMIYLSGLKPDKDIKIVFTGLRPGEKLYEELLMNEEGLKKTAHSKIFVGSPIDITPEVLTEKLTRLEQVDYRDDEAVKQILSEVVPTYRYLKKNITEKKEMSAV